MKKITLIIAVMFGALSVNAQYMNHSVNAVKSETVNSQKYYELQDGMRELWSAHMYWTLITVDAFFNDPKGIDAKLTRLLQNQKDIGDAIAPFYGQQAGDMLTKLLTEHIMGAVPVLQAAQENNTKALEVAIKGWYANATEIGDFLASANTNWPAADTRGALEMHITHTIDYSVSILKGDYSASFGGFEEALNHMLVLADILTDGIVKQFPDKF